MQPIVHPVIGYICYAVYARVGRGEPPASAPALTAILGATIPDLIDQPLYLTGVTAVGRTIGHSLLFAVPVVAIGWLLARRTDRERLGVALAIGYGSHLATDTPWHLLAGDYDELGFLLWPVTPMPPYSGVKTIGTIPRLGVEATTLWFEVVIFVAGIALWWVDGRPGLELIRTRLV